MDNLPVTVLCPVRDCAEAMPAHAAHLRDLAGVVSEIIVIDSNSTDGTLDCLKRELDGLDVVYLNHPPGLYPSWNHGIMAATCEYCTIATVGDVLPVDSLKRLTETIRKFEADAVISAPEMLDATGNPSKRRWPIHQIIAESGISGPRLIDSAEWLAMTLGFFPATLLSSSAGNLYSTEFLQKNPFPAEYGHAGDCVWALENGHKARWVIDPQVKSFFWLHPISANRQRRKEEQVRRVSEKAESCYQEFKSLLISSGIPDDFVKILGEAPRQQLEKAMIQIQYDALGNSIFRKFKPKGFLLKRSRKRIEREISNRLARTRRFARNLGSTERTSPH